MAALFTTQRRKTNKRFSTTVIDPVEELMNAAMIDDDKLLQQHIDEGADIHRRTFLNTPLHVAATNGSYKCLDKLLKNGAKVDELNWFGETGLVSAGLTGHTKCAELLIENGADVNVCDQWNQTPLISAALSGDQCSSFLRLLLKHDADVFAKDYKGKTALDYAKANKIHDMVRVLEEHITTISATLRPESTSPEPPTHIEVSQAIIANAPIKKKKKTNRCTKCTCKKCSHEKNELQKELQERTNRIAILEKKMTALELEQQDGGTITVTTEVKGSQMFGRDYLRPEARRLFSTKNRANFRENVKLAPVLNHIYAKRAITTRQYQTIDSAKTDIDKTEYLWGLMKTKHRYLQAVREALTSTGQQYLADMLQ